MAGPASVGAEEHIDEPTLATLTEDPRAFVESDLVISDEVLSIVSNVSGLQRLGGDPRV